MNAQTIKVNNMSEAKGIKGLVGQKMNKSTKFLGSDVKISKLTVAEVVEIQKRAQDIEKDETAGLEVLKLVIRSAVEGGDELTDDDFDNFPMDELSRLSNDIMKFSGMGQDQGKSS
jgi:hypothetical protein